MKCNKTYSLNVEVVKAFHEEVADQTRSRLIEALMIEFLIKYTREGELPSVMVETPTVTQEIK
jgi:hypothetical protein